MNKRRKLVVAIGAGALAAPLACFGQQPAANLRRIAYLTGSSLASNAAYLEAFRKGLREFGYIDGQNISIAYRASEGSEARLPGLAAELVRLKVEVIVTGGPQATLAAKKASGTIPVVMTNDTDPVGAGLVASLARPGGNVTGLTNISSEVSSKRLEMLKEIVPQLGRVAVFGNATIPGNAQAVQSMQAAARAMGLKLQYLELQNLEDIENAFKALAKERAQALVVFQNFVVSLHAARFLELAAKSRLPAIYGNQQLLEAGGLMFFGPSFFEQYRRAAIYVDKILKGAKPADLPVEQPTQFELAINLKTARALGIRIPQSILVRADKVIE
jgi:putative ABC transport system substrate-binding protein